MHKVRLPTLVASLRAALCITQGTGGGGDSFNSGSEESYIERYKDMSLRKAESLAKKVTTKRSFIAHVDQFNILLFTSLTDIQKRGYTDRVYLTRQQFEKVNPCGREYFEFVDRRDVTSITGLGDKSDVCTLWDSEKPRSRWMKASDM